MDCGIAEQHLLELEEISIAEERLEWLVTRAPINSTLPHQFRIDDFRIRECLTPLWIRFQVLEELVRADCYAESKVVNSIVSLICDCCSGSSRKDVALRLDRINRALGLEGFLTPGRRVAIGAVFSKMKREICSELDASY